MPDSGYTQGIKPVAPFEQRGRLLGSQFYDQTERDFVGIPIQAYKDLGKTLEGNYVKTQNMINSYNDYRSKLTTNPYNKPLIEKMDAEWNKRMQGIDSSNYQDKIYDVTGIVSDLQTKFGGNILAQNELDATNRLASIDKDPNLRESDKELLREEAKKEYGNAFEINPETGVVSRKEVSTTNLAPKYDFHKKAIDLTKTIKENTYVTGDGKSRLKPEVAKELQKLYGYHAIFNNEEVTPERIKNFLDTYFNSDPEAVEYHKSRAEAFTKNIPKTVDEIAKFYSQAELDILTGKQGSTLNDLSNLINNGTYDADELIKEGWKKTDTGREQLGATAAAVIGGSYINQKVTTIEDRKVTEEIAARAAAEKAARDAATKKEEEAQLVSNYNVSANAIGQGRVTEKDIETLNNSIPVFQQEIEKTAGDYNSMLKEVDKIRREELDKKPDDLESQKRVQDAERRLEEREKAYIAAELNYGKALELQYNIGKVTQEEYKKINGVDLEVDYKKNLKKIKEHVISVNNKILNNPLNNNLYITEKENIKKNPLYIVIGNKIGVKAGSGFKGLATLTADNKSWYIEAGKVIDGNYYLKEEGLDFNYKKNIKNKVLSEKNINTTMILGADGKKIIHTVPTLDEVTQAALTIANGEDKNYSTGDVRSVNGTYISNDIFNKADNIKKKGTLQKSLNDVYLPIFELNVTKNNPSAKYSIAANNFNNIKTDVQTSYNAYKDKYQVYNTDGKLMLTDTFLKKTVDKNIYDAIDQSSGVIRLSTKNTGAYGHTYIVTYKAKRGKEGDLPNGQYQVPVVNTIQSEVKDVNERIAKSYLSMISDDNIVLSGLSATAQTEMGKGYGATTPFGIEFEKANLWSKPVGETIKVSLKGNYYDADEDVLITVRESIRESNAFNNKDYEITKGDDILVRVNGQVTFHNTAEVLADRQKNKGNSKFSVYYASSPQEIQELIGINLLKADVDVLTRKKE